MHDTGGADVGGTGGSSNARGASTAIALHQVTKRFDGAPRPAVDSLSLEIPEGSTTVLVGPSGCGKTTTLRMINRLTEPTSGHIEVMGRDVRSQPAHELRRSIGYVIQHSGLFPHRTIAANIATVPKLLGWARSTIDERVEELTELVGLETSMLGRYPSALSGGQQQRVGVARALAADPPLLLMDEPYSAVDPIVRARLQDELIALQARLHKTIVVVSHDIDEAVKLADRIAIFADGGILAQYGPPEELLRAPANDFVESFLGEERGLKRLALLTVRDIELSCDPVIDVSASLEEAEAAALRANTWWVTITADGRLAGWASLDDIRCAGGPTGVTPKPFSTAAAPDTTLRVALDQLVTSQTRVAAVVDHEDKLLGILGIEQLSEGLKR